MTCISILEQTAKWVDRVVTITVITLLACMVVTTSAGVFWRYGLNSALSWTDELGRFLLVWISFLGAAMATYRGSHIGVNILVDRLPRRARIWVGRFVDLLIILFMSSVFVGGIKILPFIKFRVAPTLSLPMDIPYLIMPVSAGLIVFYVFVRLVSGLKQQKGAS